MRLDFVNIPYTPVEAWKISSRRKSFHYTPSKNASDDDWRSVQQLCQGDISIQPGNITNIALQCGYLFGAPRPISGRDIRIFESFST